MNIQVTTDEGKKWEGEISAVDAVIKETPKHIAAYIEGRISKFSMAGTKFNDIRDYFSKEDLKSHKKGAAVNCDAYLKEAIFDKLNFLTSARTHHKVNVGAINSGWDYTNNIFCEPIKFPAGAFWFNDNHWVPAPISIEGVKGHNTVFKYFGKTDFLSVIGHYQFKGNDFQATRGGISNIKIIAAETMERNSALINRVGYLHNHWIDGCHLTMFGDATKRSRGIGASKLKDYGLLGRFLGYGQDFTVKPEVVRQDAWQLESYTINNHIEGGNIGIEVMGRNCLITNNLTDYCEVAFFSKNLQKSRLENNIFSGEGGDSNQRTLAGTVVAGFSNTLRNSIYSYNIGDLWCGYDFNSWNTDYSDVNKNRVEFDAKLPFALGSWSAGESVTATKVGFEKYFKRSHIRI